MNANFRQPKPPSPTKQQKLVDDWNARYPVGTPVIRYALVSPLRFPSEKYTRSAAWLMGGHSAMIMVEGVAGGVMLESVVPR